MHTPALCFLLSIAVEMDPNSKAACTVDIRDLKQQFDNISFEIKKNSSRKINNFSSTLENCDRSEIGR